AQRPLLLYYHRCARRPHGLVRAAASRTRARAGSRRRAPQSAVERAPRAPLDGRRLRQLVRLHPARHRRIHLRQDGQRRAARRALLAAAAAALGVAVATAMIAVANDIGDKINRELRSYGANITISAKDAALAVEIGGVRLQPVGAALNEADLPKIKTIFWRNN